jgi:hypothetical protein
MGALATGRALQAIASELIGQNIQKRSGEREFHEGLRDWIRIRDERIQGMTPR